MLTGNKKPEKDPKTHQKSLESAMAKCRVQILISDTHTTDTRTRAAQKSSPAMFIPVIKNLPAQGNALDIGILISKKGNELVALPTSI